METIKKFSASWKIGEGKMSEQNTGNNTAKKTQKDIVMVNSNVTVYSQKTLGCTIATKIKVYTMDFCW